MPRLQSSNEQTTDPGAASGPLVAISQFLGAIHPVPIEWLSGASAGSNGRATRKGGSGLEPAVCMNYKTLRSAWQKALRWRSDLDDVLVTMLAVIVSTEQVGDQLFLQVIGEAGGGKTRLCDAVLVSKRCFPLEHLTGFHSGWKDETGEDFSLISRIDRKTLITPEGDVLMSSPRFVEIMSQQRRIFDGTSGASYKNRKEDMRYTGLRTPWIIAGTPALMDTDQSRLGDRFLRVVIDSPGEEEKDNILLSVGHTALRSVLQTSDKDSETQLDPKLCEAYKLTGGYVDWLRNNAPELLASLRVDANYIISRCSKLAEFTAYLRARPNPNTNAESEASKELPTRLTHQYVRLACCMAVVLNRQGVDDLVMQRVRKVALDTSRGETLRIVKRMARDSMEGNTIKGLSVWTGVSDYRVSSYLQFLKGIGVVEAFELKKAGKMQTKKRWRLTEKMERLFDDVTV